MSDHMSDQVMCATYTHARRHPIVLGKIAGWTPPFQISVPQMAVIVGVFAFEMMTWRYWRLVLPQTLATVLAISLPWVLAWAVRRARVEGRSLVRTAAGHLMLLVASPTGSVGGRPYTQARKADLRGDVVRVEADR